MSGKQPINLKFQVDTNEIKGQLGEINGIIKKITSKGKDNTFSLRVDGIEKLQEKLKQIDTSVQALATHFTGMNRSIDFSSEIDKNSKAIVQMNKNLQDSVNTLQKARKNRTKTPDEFFAQKNTKSNISDIMDGADLDVIAKKASGNFSQIVEQIVLASSSIDGLNKQIQLTEDRSVSLGEIFSKLVSTISGTSISDFLNDGNIDMSRMTGFINDFEKRLSNLDLSPALTNAFKNMFSTSLLSQQAGVLQQEFNAAVEREKLGQINVSIGDDSIKKLSDAIGSLNAVIKGGDKDGNIKFGISDEDIKPLINSMNDLQEVLNNIHQLMQQFDIPKIQTGNIDDLKSKIDNTRKSAEELNAEDDKIKIGDGWDADQIKQVTELLRELRDDLKAISNSNSQEVITQHFADMGTEISAVILKLGELKTAFEGIDFNMTINAGGNNPMVQNTLIANARRDALNIARQYYNELSENIDDSAFSNTDNFESIFKLQDLLSGMKGKSINSALYDYKEAINILKEVASNSGVDISLISEKFEPQINSANAAIESLINTEEQASKSADRIRGMFGGNVNIDSTQGIEKLNESILEFKSVLEEVQQILASGLGVHPNEQGPVFTYFDKLLQKIQEITEAIINLQVSIGNVQSGTALGGASGVNGVKTGGNGKLAKLDIHSDADQNEISRTETYVDRTSNAYVTQRVHRNIDEDDQLITNSIDTTYDYKKASDEAQASQENLRKTIDATNATLDKYQHKMQEIYKAMKSGIALPKEEVDKIEQEYNRLGVMIYNMRTGHNANGQPLSKVDTTSISNAIDSFSNNIKAAQRNQRIASNMEADTPELFVERWKTGVQSLLRDMKASKAETKELEKELEDLFNSFDNNNKTSRYLKEQNAQYKTIQQKFYNKQDEYDFENAEVKNAQTALKNYENAIDNLVKARQRLDNPDGKTSESSLNKALKEAQAEADRTKEKLDEVRDAFEKDILDTGDKDAFEKRIDNAISVHNDPTKGDAYQKSKEVALSNLQNQINAFQKQYDDFINNTSGKFFGDRYEDSVQTVKDQMKQILDMGIDIQNIDLIGFDDIANASRLLKTMKETVKTADRDSDMLIANPAARSGLLKNISTYMAKNTRLSDGKRNELQSLYGELQGDVTVQRLDEIKTRFNEISAAAAMAKETGRSFGDVLSSSFKNLSRYLLSFASFYRIIAILKQAVGIVKELDASLMEVRKVSSESLDNLKKWQKSTFDQADSVGGNAKQIQDSTAAWLRLGKSFTEAQEAAQASVKLLNVSEFTNIDDATTALVSMRQAFSDLTYEDFIDKLNGVGDNFSSSTDQLAQGMKNVSSVLKVAGNDIDQSLALLTAANDITQDMSKASMGVRTVALRISGTQEAKQELEDLGEDVSDFVVQTQSKVDAQVRKYTQTAKNPNGISVLDKNGRLRSTYDVLRDISEIYDEIVKKDNEFGTNTSNALLELLAGKTRSNILASILQAPDVLQNAYEQSKNSQGIGQRELDIYLDSVEAKMERLQNRLQELAMTTVSSDWLKVLIDLGTKAIETINALSKAFGGLNLAIGAIGGFVLNKKGVNLVNGVSGIGSNILGFLNNGNQRKQDFLNEAALLGGESNYGANLKELLDINKGMSDDLPLLSQFTEKLKDAQLQSMTLGDAVQANTSVFGAFKLGLTSAVVPLKTFMKGLGNMAIITFALKGFEMLAEGIYNFATREKRWIEQGKEAQKRIQETSDGFEKVKDSVDSFDADSYFKLTEKFENGTINTEEYQKLADINNELAAVLPSLVTSYDENGNAILDLGNNADEATSKLQMLLEQEKQLAAFETSENLQAAVKGVVTRFNQLQKDEKKQDKTISTLDQVKSLIDDNYESISNLEPFIQEVDAQDTELNQAMAKIANAYEAAAAQAGIVLSPDTLINSEGWSEDGETIVYKYRLEPMLDGVSNDQIETFKTTFAGMLDEAGLGNVISKEYLNAVKLKDKDISEAKAEWNSLVPGLISQLTLYGDDFENIGLELQQKVRDTITNLDISKLSESDRDALASDPRAFVRQMFLDPISKSIQNNGEIDKEKQELFSKLLKFDGSELSNEEYKNQINNIVNDITDDEDYRKQIKVILGFQYVDEDGNQHWNITKQRDDLFEMLGGEITYDENGEKHHKKGESNIGWSAFTGLTQEQLNSLSYASKNMGIDLSVISGWENLLSVIEKANKEINAVNKIESDTFSSLFKDESDEGLQKTTDAFQETIENVKKYREEIAAGDFKDAADMTQTFNENMKAGENYTDYLNRVQLKALQDFADKYKEIISGITDPKEKEDAQRFLVDLFAGMDFENLNIDKLQDIIKGRILDSMGETVTNERFQEQWENVQESLTTDRDYKIYYSLLLTGMSPQEALDEMVGPDGLSARVQLQLDKQSLQDEIDRLTSERSTNEARKSMLEAQGFSIDTDYYLEDNEISNQLIRHYEEQIKIAEEEIANSDDKDFINTQQEKINEIQRNIFSERATKASNRSAIRELMLKPFEDARKEIESQMGTLESTKALGEANGRTDFSLLNQRMIDLLNSDNEQIDAEIEQLRHQQSELSIRAKWTNKELSDMDGYQELVDKEKDLLDQRAKNNQQRIELQKEIDNAPLVNLQNIGTALSRDTADAEKAISQAEEYGGEVSRAMYQSAIDAAQAEGNNLEKQRAEIAGRIAKIEEEYELAGKAPEELLQNSNYQDLQNQLDDIDSSADSIRQKIIGWADAINNFDANKVAKQLEAINSSISADEAEIQAKRAREQEVTSDDYNGIIMNRQAAIRLAQADVDRAAMDVQNAELSGASSSRMAELDKAYAEARAVLFQAEADLYSSMEEQNQEAMNNMDAYINNQQAIISNTKAHIALLEAQGKTGSGIDYQTMIDTQGRIISTYKDEVKTARNDWNSKKGTDLEDDAWTTYLETQTKQYEAEQALIDLQVEQAESRVKDQENEIRDAKLEQTNLQNLINEQVAERGEADASLYNSLANSYTAEAEQQRALAKYWSDLAKSERNPELAAQFLEKSNTAFSDALSAEESAREQRTMPIQNELKELQNQMQDIQAEATRMEEAITKAETNHQKVGANMYKNLIKNGKDQIKNLVMQRVEQRKMLKMVDEGSEKWYEYQSNIDSLSSEISAMQNNIVGWSETMTSLVSTNAEALSSALSSAFSEMDSGTGMTIDTMNELKKQFSDLKGFNMDNVFYETADGVKMNKSAVEELVDQEYMLQQAILEEALAQENLSAADRVRYEQQLSMLQAIYDQQKANFTGYAEWQTAQSTDNAGKRYEDIQGALKSVQEMYSKGLTGTDDFRSFVSMIDQWGLDTVDAYDRNIEMVKRYVTEDSSGLVNFFNDLVSKGLATGDATEGWVLDVQNMEEAAKAMNMSTELFDILVSRSDDYGFINTWVDSVLDGQLQMKDGTQELIEAEQRLIQLQEQGADQKVIEDAARHRDELATQLKDISTATEQVQKMEGKITASQVRQQESFLDNLLSLRGQEGVDQDVLRKEFENITATLGVELNWEDVNEGDIQSEFESKFPGYLQVKAEPVIDLTNRPHVDAQDLRDVGYENVKDGTATVYSSSFSNKDETATVVVTPIFKDADGNTDILEPGSLEHYANQILEGGADEYGIGLKIFDGEDSKEQAQAYSDMLHETQALFDMDNPVLMETLDMMQNYKGESIDQIMFGDGELDKEIPAMEKQFDKLLDTMGLGQEKGEALKEVLMQMAYGVEPVNGEPTYETGLESSSFEAMRQRGLDTSSLEGSSIEVQAEVIPHITQETTQEELDKMVLEANVNAKINKVEEQGVSTTQLSNMTDEQKISLGFDESELETLNAKLAEMTTITVKIDESQIAQLTGAEDVKIGADTSEVTTAIEEAEAEVEGSEANMKIGGDAQIALATARATTTIINNMRPSIKVTAETGNLVNQIRNSLNNHVFTVRTRAAGATSAGGKKEADVTGTILSPAKASGTAYNMLNLRKISGAFASGSKVDLPEDEEALVNEVGTESIVRDGQWYLLPGGPHVESLKKGDIVFSASQTEDLLKRGRAIGHGKAYAEGSGVPLSSIPMMSAYGNPPAGGSRGKLDQTNVNLKPSKTNNNDQKKATINNTRAVNNNTSAIDNFKKWLDGWVDWIDNRLDALNNTIDRFTNRSENLIGYGKKNKDIQSAMNRIASLYTYQNADVTYTTKANGTKIAKGYKNIKNAGGTLLYDTTRGAARYQRQADDVIKHAIDAGIFGKVNNNKNRAAAEKKAMDLVDKIQTGRIDIKRYNENIREVISSYEDWFGKSQELINNLEEIKQQYKDLEQTKLDNITTQFETLADYASAVSAVSNSFVELATARGTVVNDNNIKNAYKTQMQQQGYTTGYLQKEEKAYRDELKNATKVFGIGSNEWVEALSKYQNIKQALNESETAYRNLNQQLKELDIHKVELVIERLEKYGNTLASKVSLAGRRENEYRPGSIITEKDYAVQLENNGKILQKYWENYNNRLNEIAMLNPDVDSDKYQELYNNIMGDVEAMQKLLETNEDLKDSIVELRWKNFEDFQKTLDNAISDYEHLQSLMKETQFFDADYGIRLTDRGMADIALIAKMMDTERQKIADYRKALQKLEDDYKSKNITLTKYNETSREYIEIIQQSASAVAGYKDALADLYKTQITNENNLLQENIKLRKDALQQKKSYYDYDKTLKSKNKDLAQLQSQVNALRGTTSQAGQAELARLQAQLKEAQEDMEETQRDHEYDVMQQGFDKLSEDANKILEDTIKHIDAIPEKLEETANNMLAKLNSKYDEAYTAVQQVINETGTKIGGYAEQQLQVNTDSKEALDGIKTASESINTLLTSTILQDGVVISSEFTNKIEQKIFQKQDEIIEEMRKNNEIAKARNAEWAQYVADVKAGKDNSNKTITGNNNTPQEAKPEPAKTQKQPTNTNNNKSGNTSKTNSNSFASVAATAAKTSTKQAIKDILAKGKYHKNKATAAERKTHNALWEHIVDTYHRVPTYAMYKEIAKLLGVKMSKTPTEKEKTNLYNAMKKKGYSKGSKYIDDDELNWLHNKEVVIRKSDGAILQPFNAGDMVFTSKQSENLWKMSQVDPDVIKKMVSDVDMNKFIMPGISDKLAGRTENNNNNQTIHFDSLITINGNADQQTVADLQQIAQGLVNNREFKSNVIKFVTKDMTREAAKAGYRGR